MIRKTDLSLSLVIVEAFDEVVKAPGNDLIVVDYSTTWSVLWHVLIVGYWIEFKIIICIFLFIGVAPAK